MRRRLTAARAALVRAGFAIGSRVPLRRRVLLATFHADRLEGNLAWIRDGLAVDGPDVEVATLARRVRPGFVGALLGAVDALSAGWNLARARVTVVDDYFFPMDVVKRPGTRFVQVWHAAGAFKKFGYSVAADGFGGEARRAATGPIHSNYDLCLVSAARIAPYYAEAFGQPVERFTARLGIPRTDLFFDPERRARAEAAVRARYALPAGRRVVLYAPTFRGERITEATTPTDLDLAVLERELGGDHVVLVRAHPFVTARLTSAALASPAPRDAPASFAIDASGWPDLNELMLVADVLVTDYSSAIFEFALLGRPIGFFAPDQAAYARERGFYLRFPEDLPGPVFDTTEGLAGWLRAGAFDLERVRACATATFDVADGHATRRFIDEIIGPSVS